MAIAVARRAAGRWRSSSVGRRTPERRARRRWWVRAGEKCYTVRDRYDPSRKAESVHLTCGHLLERTANVEVRLDVCRSICARRSTCGCAGHGPCDARQLAVTEPHRGPDNIKRIE